jgi:hypothetical protein
MYEPGPRSVSKSGSVAASPKKSGLTVERIGDLFDHAAVDVVFAEARVATLCMRQRPGSATEMRSARLDRAQAVAPSSSNSDTPPNGLVDLARLHPQDEIAVLHPRAARAREAHVRQLAGGLLALGELRQRRRHVLADPVHREGQREPRRGPPARRCATPRRPRPASPPARCPPRDCRDPSARRSARRWAELEACCGRLSSVKRNASPAP